MPKNDTHFHSKFVLLHIFMDRVENKSNAKESPIKGIEALFSK
jgi:hypothetical protein